MSYKEDHTAAPSSERSSLTLEHSLLSAEVDRIFENLRNRHRRLVLLLLRDGLVETMADVTVQAPKDSELSDVELIHIHLPKLADAGYIEWNRATDEISKGPCFEEVERVLDILETRDELTPD